MWWWAKASTGFLGLLVRLVVEPRHACRYLSGGLPDLLRFMRHGLWPASCTARPHQGEHEDPQALLDLARATGAKLIYLSNPDNPMGSHHPATTIAAMIEALPEGCLLALDEAYVELAPEGTAAEVLRQMTQG